jgi:hypothetical protein
MLACRFGPKQKARGKAARTSRAVLMSQTSETDARTRPMRLALLPDSFRVAA